MTLSALALFVSTAWSAPGQVPVQGFLTDASDVPVDGPTLLVLRLYDQADPVTATLLYEDLFTVDVVGGRFSVDLGSGLDPLDLDLFRDNPDVHLQVTVGTNPSLDPVPFRHVPYAAWSESAGVAQQALAADMADVASFADAAATADAATTATTATSAMTAASADSATEAQHALDADEADHALDADHATNADLATNADQATNAAALGGESLADLQAWTRDVCIEDTAEVLGALSNANLAVASLDTSGRAAVRSTQDASYSQRGALMVGSESGTNLGFDGNEILARNNGSASDLYLQNDGGDVVLGSGSSSTVSYLVFDESTALEAPPPPTASHSRFRIDGPCETGRAYIATTIFGEMFCVCVNNRYTCLN